MPIIILSHCKSMATTSCHSNQSSYPIGIKNNIFVPPAYRCYGNMVRIDFLASEEISFENIEKDDGLTDGQRTPGYTNYKLTYELSAQVS